MPVCPNCGREIRYLLEYGKETVIYKFFIMDGEPEWEWIDSSSSLTDPEYYCPECGELLFTTPEEAEAFLRKKK